MSATLEHHEPYLFTAGALALMVHLAFFTPLYFATHWASQPPEEFVVEMWDSLPDNVEQPAPPSRMEPIPQPKVVPPALPPVKADIEVREKKSKKAAVKEKAAAKARQEAERRELEAYSERVRKNVQTEQARIRAEVSTATRVQVERYQDMIRNKIRRKMKAVADVPDSAEAIFKITLLPDGTVMDVELFKSSGFPAYDNAAERAIRLAEPLPMPTDVSLQNLFRELKLSIRP